MNVRQNVTHARYLVGFKQEEVSIQYSGNPGYVVGLPLVAGTRTAEYPSCWNVITLIFRPEK